MKIKKITMKSGLAGYQCFLHDSYEDYETWQSYAEMYGLHTRLGYVSPKTAWKANPIIRGYFDPRDFSKAP